MRLPVTWPWSRGPLASRNFRVLAACNIINVAGSTVSFVALPFAVLSIGGTPSDVGYVAAAGLIPMMAFLLLGGVTADRLPRHLVLIAATALQALAQGSSATLLLTGHARVWQLAALAAVCGTGQGFYYPASQGLLPQTVTENQRSQANALDRTGRAAAYICGSALGGLLTGLAGPGWGLAADAASFAAAGALLTTMRFPARPPAPPAGFAREMREGWREFTSRRWLWLTVAQLTVLVAISAATINVLGPLVAASRLGGARSWGFILAATSAGAVLGGLAMIRLLPRHILAAALLSIPAYAPLLLALAVPLTLPLDIAAAFLAGGCLEIFAVNWATTLQQEIPSAKLSRISSYEALGSYALAPAGTAIAGPLATTFSTPAILSAGAALLILLPALSLLTPEIRHMQRRKPGEPPDRDGRSEPAGADGQDGPRQHQGRTDLAPPRQ